jgi:hypothetical protein
MLHMRLICEWYIFEGSMLDNCLCKCYTWENRKYDATSISDYCLCKCYTWENRKYDAI